MIELRPPLDTVLQALVEVGHPILHNDFGPNCCVAGTRLATTVLESIGYVTQPRVTWVRAANRAFVKAALAQQPMEIAAERGARYIEIDLEQRPHEPKNFAGHLVAVCDGMLIDLTCGQFNRPAKKILVPPWLVLALPKNWETGLIGKPLDGGGMLAYRMVENPPEFRGSPDWNPDRTRAAVEATLAAIELLRKEQS